MSGGGPANSMNDHILFKAITSGNDGDIHKLFQISGYKLTSFSNHALNWSVIQACRMGHGLLIQFLLQDGARLEIRDDEGNTPLLICSEKSEIVKVLLTLGSDVNAANNNGDTVLILTNSREVIQMLLSHHHIDCNRQNKRKYTALMAAIECCNLCKSKMLIYSGACPKTFVNILGENAFQIANRLGIGPIVELLYHSYLLDQHPLMFSSINGDFETCNILLNYNLCDKEEIIGIRPNILCVVLNCIHNKHKNSVTPPMIELVQRLCESGVSVNQCSECNRSPLDIAVDINNYYLAEILCNYRVVIPHSIIVHLVLSEATHLIPLFAVHGAPINQIDANGCIQYPYSALDIALKHAKIGIAQVLLYHGATIDVTFALIQSVETCNCKTLEFLVDECSEETETYIQGEPDLFFKAVKTGDIQILNVLLEAGADINVVYDNKTPLMNAVHLDVMQYLLEKGADVNIKSKTTSIINVMSWKYMCEFRETFYNPLSDQEMSNKIKEIIRLFLKHGAQLNDTDEEGNTALIDSVKRLCPKDIMTFLLDKGSNINQRNSKGQSALYIAVMLRDLEKLTILIYRGANIDLQNKDGLTPLHEAIHNNEILTLLLKSNASVNVQDTGGNTPLLHASNSREFFLSLGLESLVNAGSDINHVNQDGMSALMLAADNLNDDAMFILLKSNADVNIVSTKLQQPKTALSILLNKWYPNWQSQHLASELLKHGANVKYVLPEVIHRIIAMGNVQLVQKLLISGLGPMDIVLRRNILDWPLKSISPLSVCLMTHQMQLAKLLIDNWYLTQSDIKILNRDKDILDSLNSVTKTIVKDIPQPPRLELLSFICVSTAIGSDSDREDNVKKLSLPHILQEYLLFKKVQEQSFDDADDEDENLFFCHQLTNKQVGERNFDSEFYVKDEEFLEFHRYVGADSSSDEINDSDMSQELEDDIHLLDSDSDSNDMNQSTDNGMSQDLEDDIHLLDSDSNDMNQSTDIVSSIGESDSNGNSSNSSYEVDHQSDSSDNKNSTIQ